MLDPKVIEKALEQQIVRTVVGVGILLLVQNLVQAVLFKLGLAVESTAIFDGVWQLTYIEILAAFVAGGLWVLLATSRNYEQPWWMIVVGGFAAWVFIVVPLAIEIDLPNFLAQLLFVLEDVVQLAAALPAIALLDRAIPSGPATRMAGGGAPGGYGAGPGTHQYGDDHFGSQGGQAAGAGFGGQGADLGGYGGQSAGAQPASDGPAPGWYPDPHGEASSRWWDGSSWSNEVR